jgi:hypothetical protein
MLLSDKKGIRCDFCAGVHKEQFEYYSIESKRFNVLGNMSNGFQHNFSKDMCKKCYDVLIERVKKFLAPIKRLSIKCDLCTKYFSGQFSYNRLVFSLANVDVTREKPVEAENNVMDLNVGTCCMGELEAQVAKVVDTIKREGDWS